MMTTNQNQRQPWRRAPQPRLMAANRRSYPEIAPINHTTAATWRAKSRKLISACFIHIDCRMLLRLDNSCLAASARPGQVEIGRGRLLRGLLDLDIHPSACIIGVCRDRYLQLLQMSRRIHSISFKARTVALVSPVAPLPRQIHPSTRCRLARPHRTSIMNLMQTSWTLCDSMRNTTEPSARSHRYPDLRLPTRHRLSNMREDQKYSAKSMTVLKSSGQVRFPIVINHNHHHEMYLEIEASVGRGDCRRSGHKPAAVIATVSSKYFTVMSADHVSSILPY